MINIENTLSKIEEKKQLKKESLMASAYNLFIKKGINDTSISDIANDAGVAKGTFYLYFKNKYELQDILIAKKSHKLFTEALESLRKTYITNFSDQIIYVINYVIDQLTKMPILLKFISKNLSWGVYNKTINKLYERNEEEQDGLYNLFLKGVNENNLKLKNPEVTLFMIIELTSSACFNSILYNEPLPIEEFKPYLYETIRELIK